MGRIMKMKKSNDIIWNRTSDLPIYICICGPDQHINILVKLKVVNLSFTQIFLSLKLLPLQ